MNQSILNIKYILLIICLIIIWYVISFNSYGTGDVQVWLHWAIKFTEDGFWTRYFSLSDIPMITTMFVYLSGLVTKFIFGTINQSNFPGVLKVLQLPALLLTVYMSLSMAKNNINFKKLIIPITLMIMLNPAIIMNLGFLGYLDVLFAASLIGSICCLHNISNKIGNIYINTAVFSLLIVISPLIKPQYVMFLPVLGIAGAYLILKNKLIKVSILGALVGVSLLMAVVSLGADDLKEFLTRIIWTKDIFVDRILGQAFVVANFPNMWQIYNFIERQCKTGCSLYEMFFVRPLYWIDRPMAIAGKKIFFIAMSFYGFFFIKALFSKYSIELRQSFSRVVVIACVWMNVIYSYFNTAVHENHLIATVFLSVLLFALKPNIKNFGVFLFFTLFNFINLYYYYGFGLSPFFGYWAPHKFGGVSIAMILIFVYGGSLLYFTKRLIQGHLD